ncbi:TetR/AcrR family transcriptional regulator [Streptomyces albiflavescens]|uniref:TetR/AcrR family transcriptional regulator n=1 Tax=Streptomyces albiflavescens TaxID=1623582 RepID=UPI001E2B0FC7|nr:TetR/AcrR family transcriptional regulator [Streptomyces albiflavescens]
MAEPRRGGRQARGERRVEQLLDAVARLLCRTGATVPGTTAIAREAGVSPGTFYQFFADKESVLAALGERLVRELYAAHGPLFTAEHARLPPQRLTDAAFAPLLSFQPENPALLMLIRAELLGGVREMLTVRAPAMPAAQRDRVADMVCALLQAGRALVLAHQGPEADAYTAEVKAVIGRYLSSRTGSAPP